jgi:murein DD-endopeptidase MepM/ murein hydrolase activator NlpD
MAQRMAIGSAILVAGWIGIAASAAPSGTAATAAPSGTAATAGPVGTGAALAVKQAELAQMETRLAAMKSATSAMPGDAAIRARSLEARQAFLAALLAAKPGARVDMARLASLLPRKTEGADQFALVRDLVAPLPISLAKSQSGKSNRRGSAHAAVAVSQPAVVRSDGFAPLREMEVQQLAIVDRATGAAEASLRDTRALIRRLGLDPDRFIAASDTAGMARDGIGGPFIPASANIEPRFKDLFVSWGKLSTLQAAVASIPAYMPVRDYHYTSTYGVRSDPFNGGSAMHAGVDMAGSMGEPIYASADGVVKTAGKSSGYGNLIELDHGRGIDTRYGHLSKIMVHAGDRIRQGQEIGLMGSTGRSTGTHLHFEVRVDGRSVNPRPFLDASAYVLAVKGSAGGNGFDPAAPQDFGPVLNDDRVTAAADSASMSAMRSFR